MVVGRQDPPVESNATIEHYTNLDECLTRDYTTYIRSQALFTRWPYGIGCRIQ